MLVTNQSTLPNIPEAQKSHHYVQSQRSHHYERGGRRISGSKKHSYGL